MKVRTLKPHSNLYGDHATGDEYNHRRPESDIRFGYVEEMKPASATRTRKREVKAGASEASAETEES